MTRADSARPVSADAGRGPTVACEVGLDTGGLAIVLRSMRWWDLGEVLAIEQASFAADAWTPETFWAELAERGTRRYLVAESGGPPSVIGYVGVCTVSDHADVQTIAAAPGVRGQGVGRTLLRCALAEAMDAGARRIHLEVRADNAAALGLYAVEGFRRMGRRRGYYRDARGWGVDAVVMSRDLVPTDRAVPGDVAW